MPKINDSRYVAVEQNPAYSQAQPLDPFRDRTSGKRIKHNRYLPFFQSAITELPLLHGETLRSHASDWRQYFTTQNGLQAEELIVEIGCYKGKNLTELALYYPQSAFIGIDYTFKRVAITAQRLRNAGVCNAIAVLYDAHALHWLFAEQCIDGLICFFPDPWRKRKQSHNRLWSKDFCANIVGILADNSYVWLKTDVLSFFLDAKHNLKEAGLCQQQDAPHEHSGCGGLESEFEARYRKLQRRIYTGIFARSSATCD